MRANPIPAIGAIGMLTWLLVVVWQIDGPLWAIGAVVGAGVAALGIGFGILVACAWVERPK